MKEMRNSKEPKYQNENFPTEKFTMVKRWRDMHCFFPPLVLLSLFFLSLSFFSLSLSLFTLTIRGRSFQKYGFSLSWLKLLIKKGRKREREEEYDCQWSVTSDGTWNAFYSSLRTFSSLPPSLSFSLSLSLSFRNPSPPLTRNTQFDLIPLFIHFPFAIFDREKENENERVRKYQRERDRKYQRERENIKEGESRNRKK